MGMEPWIARNSDRKPGNSWGRKHWLSARWQCVLVQWFCTRSSHLHCWWLSWSLLWMVRIAVLSWSSTSLPLRTTTSPLSFGDWPGPTPWFRFCHGIEWPKTCRNTGSNGNTGVRLLIYFVSTSWQWEQLDKWREYFVKVSHLLNILKIIKELRHVNHY